MRTNILKIAASLAFALSATPAFAHAQLEKATPAVGGTVASAKRNPARIQRRRRAEIHRRHVDLGGRRERAARTRKDRNRQRKPC